MASSTAVNYDQLAFQSTTGSMVIGQHQQVIGDAVATRQLKASESGALCLFDRAAGVVYTLPTPVIGMTFDFATTVTITSNSAKVITKTIASEFIVGAVQLCIAGAATTLLNSFNGTTHVAILENGTTTGGVIGDRFRLTAISSTQWAISGICSGSGVLATNASTT